MARAFNCDPRVPFDPDDHHLPWSDDVDGDGGRVHALHAADHHAEIPQRLGAVKVKSARPGCPGAWTPTTTGDPLACTPLATTAYSAGTVIRSTAVA